MSISLHTVTGADLPDLVWHHERADDGLHVDTRFRTPKFDGWTSKPNGGLWAAVMLDHTWPYLSAWGEYSRYTGVRSESHFASRILPVPDDRFVVVNTEADAVAVVQAFRGAASMFSMMLQGEHGSPPEVHFRWMEDHPVPDLTLLAGQGYAGLWLTDQGRIATRHTFPAAVGVPSFWGWDVETVWFGVPRLDVVDTRRWEPA